MRPKVYEVIETIEEDGTVKEEYIELKLVEVIEHRPDEFEDFNVGRFINVII